MRIMVVWLQNFQGGQSPSKYPTYVVQFMISPQMRFSWPKKWEKLSFSNEKMVVWLQNFWGGLSSSKYTILNHFWLGQLKPPRLTQCLVCQPPTFLPDIRKYAGFYEVFPKSGQKIGQSNQSVSTWHNRSVFSNVVTSLLLSASFALLTM